MKYALILVSLLTTQALATEGCVTCCKPKSKRKPVVQTYYAKKAQPSQSQKQEQSTVVNVPVTVEIRQEPAKAEPAARPKPCEPVRRSIKVGVHAGYGRSGLKLSEQTGSSATISQDRGFIGGGYLGVRVYKDLWISGNGLSNGDVFGSVGLEF
jgi:hypothetical protein